jgi:hypothetical protein
MDYLLDGFTDELLKLASRKTRAEREDAELRALYREVKKKSQRGGGGGLKDLRGKGRQVSRDYLASTAIGAAAAPAAVLLGGKISRLLHNRDVAKAMKGLRGKRRRAVAKHLESGKLVGGPKLPGMKGKPPMFTRAELAGHAVRGGAMGSIIQMLRDRFSGSAGVNR